MLMPPAKWITKMHPLNKTEILLVLRMPHGIRATYLLWRLGIDPKYSIARETYARHRQTLAERYGVDITAPPA